MFSYGERFQLHSEKFPSENIPPSILDASEPCVIGIDEAGRGPVLGPLVYALFVCPLRMEASLKGLGANDSKALRATSRESFFQRVLFKSGEKCKDFGWCTRIIHPEYISNCMLSLPKTNLNTVSFNAVYSMIEQVLQVGVPIKAGFVDTLGSAESYQKELTRRFPSIEWTVRSKADALFPPTGASSIVAKVIRDDVLATCWAHLDDRSSSSSSSSSSSPLHDGKQKNPLLSEISGYPGDSQTVKWLREHVDPVFGFPDVVRFSWSTCRSLLEDNCHSVKWEDVPLSPLKVTERASKNIKSISKDKKRKFNDKPVQVSTFSRLPRTFAHRLLTTAIHLDLKF